MPVDRERRDALAEALASFLRQESDLVSLDNTAQGLDRPGDDARDRGLDEVLTHCHLIGVSGMPPEEEWDALLRRLAFLGTGLEGTVGVWIEVAPDDAESIIPARWHALGLSAALAVAWLTRWWMFAVAALASFLLFQMAHRTRVSVAWKEREEWEKTAGAFCPFADREQWQAHEHLLERHRLPAFDAELFAPTIRPLPLYPPLPGWAVVASGVVCVAMMIAAIAFSSLLWPLWVAAIACGRSRPVPSHRFPLS